MRLALSSVAVTFWALALCSNASAEDVLLPPSSAPACASGLRLRAVQFDPNREERSFVLFAGSARLQPLHRGARVGAYKIDQIDRGAVVLATQSQRCTVRLKGEQALHERGVVSADAVRSGLRPRQPIAAMRSAATSSSTNRNGI
jgi:hypothetical protein